MNWFVYRMPGDTGVSGAWSERLLSDPNAGSGFLISTFRGGHDKVLLIPSDHIVSDPEMIPSIVPAHVSGFPQESTSRMVHRRMVEKITSDIKSGKLSKCVAARTIVKSGSVDIPATFGALCSRLPDAFVFAFSTEHTGTWMGASPEVLLTKRGNEYCTYALAGTRPSGTAGAWDKKNINEQQVVADYLESVLREVGLNVETEGPVTREAGPVEHILSLLRGYDLNGLLSDPLRLACLISPTPALSGFPRETALGLIGQLEGFDRGCYGGFCGLSDPDANALTLFVNIRSMRIEPDRYSLFAGGGIMADSDPEEEWAETERKAATLEASIILKN